MDPLRGLSLTPIMKRLSHPPTQSAKSVRGHPRFPGTLTPSTVTILSLMDAHRSQSEHHGRSRTLALWPPRAGILTPFPWHPESLVLGTLGPHSAKGTTLHSKYGPAFVEAQ